MLKQGEILVATGNFQLRKFRASRGCEVKVGDRFWVTSSTLANKSGLIAIDREGRGQISQGYALTFPNIMANFAREIEQDVE